MSNEELIKQDIDQRITELTKQIDGLNKLKDTIKDGYLPDVVIHKNTREICVPEYRLDHYSANIDVRIADQKSANGSVIINMERFNNDYVEYTPKTRKMFPKK